MAMFTNLGQTLSLLRELRGQSQARVAREAGIGKSQLSKYENGKELPKLDSLEKVLNALNVGYFEFFYTQFIVDRRAAELERPVAPELSDEPLGEPLFLPPLPNVGAFLAGTADQAFSRVFTDLLVLYRRIFEQLVLSGRGPEDVPVAPGATSKTRRRSSSQRAAASSPPRSASPR
jgi:transcriptional regulator with XRE-family HTH domain